MMGGQAGRVDREHVVDQPLGVRRVNSRFDPEPRPAPA